MSPSASSSGHRMQARSPIEVLAVELGEVAGRIERDSKLRIDAAMADIARREAERELRLLSLERRMDDRLASLKDGEPGRSISVDDVAPLIQAEVARQVAQLPPAEPGRSITVDDVRPMLQEMVEALPPAERGPQGERGPEGRLAAVRAWEDRVHYDGAVVTHEGSTWQAQRDTGHAPPHADWVCIARAGCNGADGISLEIQGTYDPERKDYRRLSVVTLNGGSFVARRDDPGPCPGEGWQLFASQGKRGQPGERGPAGKGERGEPGPAVAAMYASDQGMVTLVNADGSTVEMDLYPLLSKLQG